MPETSHAGRSLREVSTKYLTQDQGQLRTPLVERIAQGVPRDWFVLQKSLALRISGGGGLSGGYPPSHDRRRGLFDAQSRSAVTHVFFVTDVVYNGIALALGALLIWRQRRIPAPWPPTITALTWIGSAAVVAVLLEFDRFGQLRLLAYTVFVHAPLALIWFATRLWSERRALAMLVLLLPIVAWGIAYEAFVREPHDLEVTRYALRNAKLTQPLTIVVLSDIQTDAPGAYEQEVLHRAMAEQPDLVLMPGDYVQQHDPLLYETARTQLNQLFVDAGLSAPLGVFAVEGNVDAVHPWARVFDKLAVTAFERSGTVSSGPVSITGLTLSASFDTARVIGPATGFHIALGHAPDFALGNVAADLIVAGHTHGGQVRLPPIGPLMTLSRVPRAWAAGKTELSAGKTLIVSRGIGMERGRAPRLRFLCRPELVVIRVEPEPAR